LRSQWGNKPDRFTTWVVSDQARDCFATGLL
jgi:hypothetical protein